MVRFAVVGVCIAGSMAAADVVRVNPFVGDASESFEGFASGFVYGPRSAFGGTGVALSDSTGWTHATGSWGFKTTVRAYEGSWLFGSTSDGVAYEFSQDAYAFGGMFATNSDVPGGKIQFFGADGSLIGVQSLDVPSGSWQWNGFASDQAFRRVVINGNYYGDGKGGFVLQDALQVSFTVPAPSSATLAGLGILALTPRRRGA